MDISQYLEIFNFGTNLGIDFRQTHLVLTILRKTFGKIRLVDYGVYPLFTGGQKEVQEAQWISFITDFISKHPFNLDRVVISIPREKVVARFLRFPAAAKENLRKVLEYEAPKYTPFDKDELCFDYQILHEDKESIQVIAVYARKEEINLYLALLKKIGVQPLSIQIPSVAALNLFFLHQGDKGRDRSILLDMSSPFFEMNLLQGKNWEESFHLPLSPDDDYEGVILHTLKRVGWNGEKQNPPAFFVYGLDAGERGLPTFHQADPLQEVNPPPLDRIQMVREEAKPDYIYPSIGLALQGLTRTRFDLNLLPQDLRKKVGERAKYVCLTFAVMAVVLLGTLIYGGYLGYSQTLRALQTQVEKRKPQAESVAKLKREAG
ncbi:MAG: pilus assembly protein PilM [Deltaproteobacteria bacterium]|nr:pilus assembly protein PilM [Deltaproteobacteria bacterium]